MRRVALLDVLFEDAQGASPFVTLNIEQVLSK